VVVTYLQFLCFSGTLPYNWFSQLLFLFIFSSCDVDVNLPLFRVNHRAKYLCQRSFSFRKLLSRRTHTTHNRLIAVSGRLKCSVIKSMMTLCGQFEPVSGPVAGGTLLTIVGRQFGNGSSSSSSSVVNSVHVKAALVTCDVQSRNDTW